jgi:hypothetical protein
VLTASSNSIDHEQCVTAFTPYAAFGSQRSLRQMANVADPENIRSLGAHHTPRQVLLLKQVLSQRGVCMSIRKFIATASGLIAVATLATTVTTPAAAQGGINLVPWVGAYVPTSNSIGSLGEDLSRDVSVAGGARLTFWGSRNLGFEVTGGYAPSKIGDQTVNESVDLLLANARLMLALSPVTNSVGFYIAGGPALLARGSNPFDDDQSSTDLGGTLGLGFRFGGGENSKVGFRLDLEDYLYNGDFGGGDDFQNDLVASLGVSIGLGGSPR